MHLHSVSVCTCEVKVSSKMRHDKLLLQSVSAVFPMVFLNYHNEMTSCFCLPEHE